MNTKQLRILQGLNKENSKWTDALRVHFQSFVERDLQRTFGDRFYNQCPIRAEIHADEVLDYFSSLASLVDLSKSPLTIEQMLHLVLTDLALLKTPFVLRGRDREFLLEQRARSITTMPGDWAALGDFSETLTAETEQPLTPDYLRNEVVPFVDALETVQHVSEELRGYLHSDVVVRQIKQKSPLDISLEGVSDAIDSLKEDIVPWRRKNAQKIADLKRLELEADIEKKKAEALQII